MTRRRRAAAPEGRLRRSEELELKYDVGDPDAVARWLDERFPAGSDERWRTRTVSDRYFDTADGALAAAGYGARLRRTDRRTSLGLKSDVDVEGGLHRRREVEAPATGHLDPARWPASEARALVETVAGGRPLVERFVINQRRRERMLRMAGACVLVSLDEAHVLADHREVAVLRGLEIELDKGRRTALRRIGSQLEQSGLVVGQPLSKLQLAGVHVAAAQPISADHSFAEAGRTVLARPLARMLDREIGTRAGDRLALKQMRVATRRTRAAWRVFGTAYRRRIRRGYLDELQQLGRRLGTVRDLDVLLAALPDEAALAPLADTWRARRDAAFAELLAHLDAPEYRRFVNAYLGFVTQPGASVRRGRGELSVGTAARPALARAHDRLIRVARPAHGSDDPKAWHAVRLETRRLRYTVEFFAELFARPRTKRLLARLIRVQDDLGALNDAAVAVREIDAWLESPTSAGAPEAARRAAGDYRDQRAADADRLRRALGRSWRGVAEPSFRLTLEKLTSR